MNKLKTSERKHEHWIERRWRPAMGWMYFAVCIFDFIIFPVLHALFQARFGSASVAWEPLTLKGGGMFHIAMGAVLGVAAWTRGKEKLARYERGHYDVEDDEDYVGDSDVTEPKFYRYRG